MAGEEKESRIAGRKPSRQFVELVDQRLPAKVLAADHLKAEAFERIADRARIVDGFHQLLIRRHIGIALIADDERHALLSIARHCAKTGQQQGGCEGCNKAHRRVPIFRILPAL